jgi:hypothetical protein
MNQLTRNKNQKHGMGFKLQQQIQNLNHVFRNTNSGNHLSGPQTIVAIDGLFGPRTTIVVA